MEPIKRKFVAIQPSPSYIARMTRLKLARLAVVGAVLTLAVPLVSYASAPGPTPTRPGTPTDTLTKLDKAKSERSSPTPKKKLKARQTVPTATVHPEFVPDQPWETDFYVENGISGGHAIQLALASFTPRR